MALFNKNGRSVFAVGLLCGSMTVFAYAQSNEGMKSVLVREDTVVASPPLPEPAIAPQPAIPAASSAVSTSYPSLSDNETVWFGDTPVLGDAGIETLQPQPTPLRSIEDKVVSNGSEIVDSPPVTALPAPVARPQDFMLDALGLNTSESAAGPRVKGVVAGGIANQIGFRPGDVITSVQGNEIYSAAELVQGLRKAVRSGEPKIPLVGIRAGRPFLVTASTEDLRQACLLYTSPSPRDQRGSRMPSSA